MDPSLNVMEDHRNEQQMMMIPRQDRISWDQGRPEMVHAITQTSCPRFSSRKTCKATGNHITLGREGKRRGGGEKEK